MGNMRWAPPLISVVRRISASVVSYRLKNRRRQAATIFGTLLSAFRVLPFVFYQSPLPSTSNISIPPLPSTRWLVYSFTWYLVSGPTLSAFHAAPRKMIIVENSIHTIKPIAAANPP
jgi:hypothetical protein